MYACQYLFVTLYLPSYFGAVGMMLHHVYLLSSLCNDQVMMVDWELFLLFSSGSGANGMPNFRSDTMQS